MAISEILSNAEVEMLLSPDDKAAANSTNAAGFSPYSFSKYTEHNINDYIVLDSINEIFFQQMEKKLAHLTCHKVKVEESSREIKKFDEFIKAQEKPSIVNYISLSPLAGMMLTTYNYEMVTQLIECLLGGNLANTINKQRNFGKIELNIVNVITNLINQCLTQSWHDIKEINFQLVKTITNPSLVNIIQNDDLVLVINYQLHIGEHQCQFSVCMPLLYLEPIFHLLMNNTNDSIPDKEAVNWKSSLKENMFNTEIVITAVIEKINFKMDALLKLKQGDIIPIENPLYAELVADNIFLFKVKCGKKNENRVAVIL